MCGGMVDAATRGGCGMSAAVFLSLMLASLGFSALRLSTARDRATRAGVLRWTGAALIFLSCAPVAATQMSIAIGIVCWLFCILPLSALPGIALWPFSSRAALGLPPAMFALLALVSASL